MLGKLTEEWMEQNGLCRLSTCEPMELSLSTRRLVSTWLKQSHYIYMRSVEPHKHSIACSSWILLNSEESGWTSKEPRPEYHEGTRSSRLPSWCNMLHQFTDIESDSERWKGQILAYCSIWVWVLHKYLSTGSLFPKESPQHICHTSRDHGMTTTGNCRIGKKQYDLVVCFV